MQKVRIHTAPDPTQTSRNLDEAIFLAKFPTRPKLAAASTKEFSVGRQIFLPELLCEHDKIDAIVRPGEVDYKTCGLFAGHS